MHQIAYNQNGLQETGGAYSAAELLAALTPEDYQRLVGFARYRLRTVVTARWLQRHLADTDAEDLVAEALLKIQLGEQDSRLGRRLKPENRATTASFLVGVKGVINSDLSHLLDSARNRCEHLSIGEPETEPGAVNPPDPTDPGRLLLRRDLHRVLFSQLYARAAEQPRLLAVIKEWDQKLSFRQSHCQGRPQPQDNLSRAAVGAGDSPRSGSRAEPGYQRRKGDVAVSRDSFWGGPLFRYTRADALRDGVLLDVTETAQTCANLTVAAAITVGLWRSLAPGEEFNPTDERLKEVLYRLSFAMAGLIPSRFFDVGNGVAICFKAKAGAKEIVVKAVAQLEGLPLNQIGLACTIMLEHED